MSMSKFATPTDYWMDQAQRAVDAADRAAYALFQIKRFSDAGPATMKHAAQAYDAACEVINDLQLHPTSPYAASSRLKEEK